MKIKPVTLLMSILVLLSAAPTWSMADMGYLREECDMMLFNNIVPLHTDKVVIEDLSTPTADSILEGSTGVAINENGDD